MKIKKGKIFLEKRIITKFLKKEKVYKYIKSDRDINENIKKQIKLSVYNFTCTINHNVCT